MKSNYLIAEDKLRELRVLETLINSSGEITASEIPN